jgi:hypothetical protein
MIFQIWLKIFENFADDSKLIAIIKNSMDREILQTDVDRLVEWAELWEMSFNKEKCKVMTIQSGRSQSVKNIIENSTKIQMDFFFLFVFAIQTCIGPTRYIFQISLLQGLNSDVYIDSILLVVTN